MWKVNVKEKRSCTAGVDGVLLCMFNEVWENKDYINADWCDGNDLKNFEPSFSIVK